MPRHAPNDPRLPRCPWQSHEECVWRHDMDKTWQGKNIWDLKNWRSPFVATPRQQEDQGMALQVDPLKANIPGLTRACAKPNTHTHTHTLSLSLSLNCTKLFNTFLLCKGKRKILRKYMYCWWLGLLLILPQIVLITIATTNDMIKISSSSHVILEHMEWACYPHMWFLSTWSEHVMWFLRVGWLNK